MSGDDHNTMTVIPLADAADCLRLSPKVLTCLIQNGTLKLRIFRTQDGQIMLDERRIILMAKAMALRDKIWKQVAKFEGETVGTSEAMEIYHITPTLLYRCLNSNPPIIRTVGGTSGGGRGRKRLLNKADVLYVAELAKRGGGRGYRLFNSDTIPPHVLAIDAD